MSVKRVVRLFVFLALCRCMGSSDMRGLFYGCAMNWLAHVGVDSRHPLTLNLSDLGGAMKPLFSSTVVNDL